MTNTTQPAGDAQATAAGPTPTAPRLGPIGQTVAFLICVGFPGLWTWAMPVSWLKIERQGETVSANAKVCLFFAIPYRSLAISGVTDVGTRASIRNTSNTTPRKGSPAEDEHFLVLRGDDDQTIEFPVAASSRSSLQEKTQAFLHDPHAAELSFFAVSSWAGSVFGGGVLSLLTVAYLFNAFVLLIQAVQRRCGVAPKNLFFAERPESESAVPPSADPCHDSKSQSEKLPP